MSSYFIVFGILFVLLVHAILAFFYPHVFIRLQGRKAVFSKYSKYDLFSSSKSEEFKKDVLKYKNRKGIEIIIISLIILGLLSVVMFA